MTVKSVSMIWFDIFIRKNAQQTSREYRERCEANHNFQKKQNQSIAITFLAQKFPGSAMEAFEWVAWHESVQLSMLIYQAYTLHTLQFSWNTRRDIFDFQNQQAAKKCFKGIFVCAEILKRNKSLETD